MIKNDSKKTLTMFILIIAGEAVFFLPFVVSRIFRPTFLKVFELTNFQLGSAFSIYGMVAFASYFAGGPLADRFSTRKLMAFALISTSLGGVVMAQIPSFSILTMLYGFWGLTTILLFWAALIRATREWGGDLSQGKAYGILDGGRGFFAALMASILVFVFSTFLPENSAEATASQLKDGLSSVILVFSSITALTAVLVFFLIPDSNTRPDSHENVIISLKKVLKLPAVWMNSVIVLCAYVGYKCTDDFSLYASDAFGYNDVDSANIGTISYWARPLAAVAAGLIGDRLSPSKVISYGFTVVIVGAGIIVLNPSQLNGFVALALVIATTSIGIYGLRGVYFALIHEARIPLSQTGAAVGVVSFLGYTPDIFMGPLMGILLDNSPGTLGHQHVFLSLCIFSVLGLLISFYLRKLIKA